MIETRRNKETRKMIRPSGQGDNDCNKERQNDINGANRQL